MWVDNAHQQLILNLLATDAAGKFVYQDKLELAKTSLQPAKRDDPKYKQAALNRLSTAQSQLLISIASKRRNPNQQTVVSLVNKTYGDQYERLYDDDEVRRDLKIKILKQMKDKWGEWKWGKFRSEVIYRLGSLTVPAQKREMIVRQADEFIRAVDLKPEDEIYLTSRLLGKGVLRKIDQELLAGAFDIFLRDQFRHMSFDRFLSWIKSSKRKAEATRSFDLLSYEEKQDAQVRIIRVIRQLAVYGKDGLGKWG